MQVKAHNYPKNDVLMQAFEHNCWLALFFLPDSKIKDTREGYVHKDNLEKLIKDVGLPYLVSNKG